MAEAAPLTLRPTLAELGDWEGLVATMEERGAHLVGVARLVMPEGWVARRQGYSPDSIPLTIASPLTQRILPTEVRGAFDHQAECHRAPLTVAEFESLASSPPHLPPPGTPRHQERLYWARPRTAAPPSVYGADVPASLMDAELEVFNLARLNSAPGAVLGHDQGQGRWQLCQGPRLGGVHTPYLFFGMWGSTFSWHTEDMDLYGVNYLHHGAPKTWYVVPPSQGHKLEHLARRLFPRDAAVCHNLLRHKSVLLQPELLAANGVTVHRVLQRAGQAIVVFPSAYHAGFNHGYNLAEAVNFGTERWLDYGMRARGCQCAGRRAAVRIDMAPLIDRFRPAVAAAWRTGEDLALHPEDPPHLAAFLAHAIKRFAADDITEEKMEEIVAGVRETATIPSWYGQRFGVEFDEEKEVVYMVKEGGNKRKVEAEPTQVNDSNSKTKVKHEVIQSEEKSEYEMVRERNIKERMDLLASLGIQENVAILKASLPRKASKKSKTVTVKKKRRSLRTSRKQETLTKVDDDLKVEDQVDEEVEDKKEEKVEERVDDIVDIVVNIVTVWVQVEEQKESIKKKCTEAGCSKSFNHYASLSRHTRTVHRGVAYQCQECQKRFFHKFNLRHHVRAVHMKEKPHKCELDGCGAQFATKEQLNIHMRSNHDEEKFKCPRSGCLQEFVQLSGLNRHIRAVHMGERPFVCPETSCLGTFTSLSNLKLHTRMVHRREKLYRCGEEGCASRFSTRTEVQDHGRHQHGKPKLRCREDACGKQFVWASHLYKHMKVHRK